MRSNCTRKLVKIVCRQGILIVDRIRTWRCTLVVTQNGDNRRHSGERRTGVLPQFGLFSNQSSAIGPGVTMGRLPTASSLSSLSVIHWFFLCLGHADTARIALLCGPRSEFFGSSGGASAAEQEEERQESKKGEQC